MYMKKICAIEKLLQNSVTQLMAWNKDNLIIVVELVKACNPRFIDEDCGLLVPVILYSSRRDVKFGNVCKRCLVEFLGMGISVDQAQCGCSYITLISSLRF